MKDSNPTSVYSPGTFPSPLLPKKQQDLKETGLGVAKAIYSSCIDGENAFYSIRNGIFAENRTFALGRQPFQTYLDLLGIDGKTSFMNLDYHPRPVAPKFRDILVNDIMNKIEGVDCTGLSHEIQKKKADKRNEMAFRMQQPEFIQQFQQTTGMQMTSPTDYVPENEDELELWSQLNDKEKEELLMEDGIDFILYNNDWNSIKKEIAEDLVDTGLACNQTYFDGRKRIRLKKIRSEYMVYGTTNTLNFRNVAYMAHVERISITDIRCMYPDMPEKEIWDFAFAYRQLNGNPNQLNDFIIDFETAYTRPYDSWLIDVLFYEYKVVKTIDYVKGTDGNDNPIFEFRKGKTGNPKKTPYNTRIPTIYKGAWVMGADTVLEWGEMKNLIRNNEDVEDISFSYSVYMLNNNGDMLPLSPMKAIRSSIIQMDLAILRMQNTLATTPKNGLIMDIDSIMEIDLGKGMDKVGPMKMMEIYQQTGNVFYSGSKISGDPNKPPIQQLLSSYGDQLNAQIEVYNFELNNIRDYIGINEVKDGTEINPRMGLGVMNGAQQASNTATAHIYGGVVSIMTDTVKSIATLLWDALNTPTTNDMYIRLLGKQNAEFMQYRDELTKTNYSTRISINIGMADMQFIELTLQNSLQQGKLLPEDALMVKKYAKYNTDYAIRYLSLQEKKRAKDLQRQQMELAQQQQQATAQQAQQVMQAKAQEEADADERELKKQQMKGDQEHRNMMQELINGALLAQMQYGTPLPQYVQILIDEQMKAHGLQQEAQMMQLENELMQSDLQALVQDKQEAAMAEQQAQQQTEQGNVQDPSQQGQQVAA